MVVVVVVVNQHTVTKRASSAKSDDWSDGTRTVAVVVKVMV